MRLAQPHAEARPLYARGQLHTRQQELAPASEQLEVVLGRVVRSKG
jgi:hypothetical protein